MNARRTRAASLGVLLALSLATGCGSGGFGTSEPTSPPSHPLKKYVALGDGFSSAPYLGADTSPSGCLRSADDYPGQVARALKVETLTNVTCVGATTADLTKQSTAPDSRTKLAAQLDAVKPDTDLVTLGIGIEDDNLLHDIFRLCEKAPCGSDVPPPKVLTKITAYGVALTSAVRTIQDIAPRAEIVVVGYPQLMPPNGTCSALPQMTEVQLGYSWYTLQTLNKEMRSAAQQTGASFVDVAALSTDHTACSDVPWVHGSTSTPGKALAYHPLAVEQTAVAEAVQGEVRDASTLR